MNRVKRGATGFAGVLLELDWTVRIGVLLIYRWDRPNLKENTITENGLSRLEKKCSDALSWRFGRKKHIFDCEH